MYMDSTTGGNLMNSQEQQCDPHVSKVLHEKAVEAGKKMLAEGKKICSIQMSQTSKLFLAKEPKGKNVIHSVFVEGEELFVVF